MTVPVEVLTWIFSLTSKLILRTAFKFSWIYVCWLRESHGSTESRYDFHSSPYTEGGAMPTVPVLVQIWLISRSSVPRMIFLFFSSSWCLSRSFIEGCLSAVIFHVIRCLLYHQRFQRGLFWVWLKNVWKPLKVYMDKWSWLVLYVKDWNKRTFWIVLCDKLKSSWS